MEEGTKVYARESQFGTCIPGPYSVFEHLYLVRSVTFPSPEGVGGHHGKTIVVCIVWESKEGTSVGECLVFVLPYRSAGGFSQAVRTWSLGFVALKRPSFEKKHVSQQKKARLFKAAHMQQR